MEARRKRPSARTRSARGRNQKVRRDGGDVRRTIPVVCVSLVLAASIAALQNGCATGPHRDPAGRADPSYSLARGDTTEALRTLEKTAGNRSAPPETFLLLGRLYRSRGSITDRLRAQGILEDGLRRYPDHPDLLAELGATLYAQTLYGDAERVFRRLLEIDPQRCDALYYLGINAYRKWKRVQSYTDYLGTAEGYLGIAVECDSAMDDAYFKLAFSRCVLSDTARALETCAAYRAAFPTAPEPLLLSGSIAYASADFETCRDRFEEALSLMDDEERTNYTDLSLLLPDGDERDAYASAPSSDRIETERLYWIADDPDPTTEINERQLEHVYRVFMSGARYESSSPPIDGWDTPRGKALVKFGEPDHIETTLKGLRPMDGRTEIWTYLGTEQPFVLFFRDEYLNGNDVVPIEDAISAWTIREDPPLTAHLPGAADVPGTLAAVAFRESETEARVYLVYAADADSLDHRLWTWDTARFRARTAVYLADGRPHRFSSRVFSADSLTRYEEGGAPSYVTLEELSLPFGSYRAAFCLEDEHRVTRSIAWADLATARLIGESLVTSDLALCSRPDSDGPSILRGGSALRINPSARYAAGEDLFLYLELYNLELRGGRSRCDLSYSIRRAEAARGFWDVLKRGAKKLGLGESLPPPVISQTFERVGTSGTTAEEIAVGIGSLDPGSYEITVTAVDAATGESASVTGRFVKAGDKPRGTE
jgi:GWxTD domain-containing protein